MEGFQTFIVGVGILQTCGRTQCRWRRDTNLRKDREAVVSQGCALVQLELHQCRAPQGDLVHPSVLQLEGGNECHAPSPNDNTTSDGDFFNYKFLLFYIKNIQCT